MFQSLVQLLVVQAGSPLPSYADMGVACELISLGSDKHVHTCSTVSLLVFSVGYNLFKLICIFILTSVACFDTAVSYIKTKINVMPLLAIHCTV